MKQSEFKKKYKAIISDIDNTLTFVSPNALPSAEVTKAIEKVKQKGIAFSLATGRPFTLIEYLVKHLQLSSPLIIDNGAVIIDPEKDSILWQALLSQEETMDILGLTKDYKLKRVSTDINNFENPKSIPKKAKIRKISIHDLTPKETDELIKKLEDKFKNLAIVRAAAFGGREFFDVYVSNAEATKQHAIVKYAEMLGISTSEIIGIGDHYNDFPLLMACGLKVAMGNAVDDLKEIADYIAPSVEEDGVADVIEKFVLK